MKKITKITYNWHQVEGGEDYYLAEVGKESYPDGRFIKEIIEHCSVGIGDKWYYDIVFTDGTCKRIFNPNTVYFNQL